MSFAIKLIVVVCFVAYFCGTAQATSSIVQATNSVGTIVNATRSQAMSGQKSSAAVSAMMSMASVSNSIGASKSGNDMSPTVVMNTTTTMKPTTPMKQTTTNGSSISTVTPFAILAAFLLVIVA